MMSKRTAIETYRQKVGGEAIYQAFFATGDDGLLANADSETASWPRNAERHSEREARQASPGLSEEASDPE